MLMKILTWSVRGLKGERKMREVKSLIQSHGVDVLGQLEYQNSGWFHVTKLGF